MSITWAEAANLTTAGLSAIAATGAWMAARKANRTAEAANQTSESASATADSVARIEKARWHAELTPVFEATIKRRSGGHEELYIKLQGPVHLRHLDAVTVSIIQSDDLEYVSTLAGAVPREEVEQHVWAPYRFTPSSDGADAGGHRVAPFPLQVGRGKPFSFEKTRPPHWWEGGDVNQRWRDKWVNKPMRLRFHCIRGDDEPWSFTQEVDVPAVPRARTM